LNESDEINDLAENLGFTVFESHCPELIEMGSEKWEVGLWFYIIKL
jgi:hypothetical protein